MLELELGAGNGAGNGNGQPAAGPKLNSPLLFSVGNMVIGNIIHIRDLLGMGGTAGQWENTPAGRNRSIFSQRTAFFWCVIFFFCIINVFI